MSTPGPSVPSLVENNFIRLTRIENKSGRYNYKCKICGDGLDSKGACIEHRGTRLIEHLSSTKTCHAPKDVRDAALRALASKRTASEAGHDSGDIVALKKQKSMKNGGTQGTLVGQFDYPLTEAQTRSADVKLLRFLIHANVAFRASDNEYLDSFINDLRPSYRTPSRFTLTTEILPSEWARVHLVECERLSTMIGSTVLIDGWEDLIRRSLYGVIAAKPGYHPVVMDLADQTGERATADKTLETALGGMKAMGVEDGKLFIAVTTDNPTTMRSFRSKFEKSFYWIIPLACFVHSVNTLIGEICSYPMAKLATKNGSRLVTFFNSSHYWGGQLTAEAERHSVTRGLKKNCESRWYALVLLLISVSSHQFPLTTTCCRPDAQKKTNNLSPVAPDVIKIALDPTFWSNVSQMIRILKPCVDIIGYCEARNVNLADCMLQLIRYGRILSKMVCEDDDDPEFLEHARNVFDRRFKLIATPIHFLALFCHPMCRKLAISPNSLGVTFASIEDTAVNLAKKWRWKRDRVILLVKDLATYNQCKVPFAGGDADGKVWWDGLPISSENHPLKAMAITLLSIVPHAADVERLFSSLNGIQNPRRCNLTVDHFRQLGQLRNHYQYLLSEKQIAAGKSTQRKHAHMHTKDHAGTDVALASSLTNPLTWIAPLDGAFEPDEVVDPIVAAFEDLQKTLELEKSENDPEENARVSSLGSISRGQIFNFEELDRVEKGIMPKEYTDEINIIGDDDENDWDPSDILRDRV